MDIFSATYSFFRRNCLLGALVAAIIFGACAGTAAAQNAAENDPIALFNQGQDAHEKGDFAAAIGFYDEALKAAPEFPEAEYQKGNALVSLGKNAEAERAFRQAVALRPDWTLPMSALGGLLIQKNAFAEAGEVLTKAVGLDAQNFPGYAALVELRLKTGANPAELRELLAKISNLSGKANPPASIWAARAALENALNDRTAAKTSINRALEIDPKNQPALIERAEIALSEGDASRAAEIAAKIGGNSPDVMFLRARVAAAAGKMDEALKILDSIENPPASVVKMRDNLRLAQTTSSAELQKQLEKDDKNAAILTRLCSLLRVENPLQALEYCRRAAAAEPENINHAVGFGAALVQAQKYPEAVALLGRLKAAAPDNYTVRANLATALFQMKRYAEAQAEYQWLSEKQPDLAIAFYFLAITHDRLGEYLDAAANYQQFLRIADAEKNRLEIEKVNLRLPELQKLIKKKDKK